jgi:transcriptional regulator with XRE-family HTH domain
VSHKNHLMSITSEQIRAAKAIIRWSGEDLAQAAGVSLSSIRRIEAASGIPKAQNMRTVLAIKAALEAAGVDFIGSPDDRPGVRLKSSGLTATTIQSLGNS